MNAMTLQPFINYNLPKGWYLTSSPLITADWEADHEDIPVSGMIGGTNLKGRAPGGLIF